MKNNNNNKIALFVTHQGILRLLCAQLMNDLEYGNNKFFNCALIKINTQTGKISLVYNENNKKKSHWKINTENPKLHFDTVMSQTHTIIKTELKKTDYNIIYFARHAEGTHNNVNFIKMSRTINPKLTTNGRNQAYNLGTFIKNNEQELYNNIINNKVNYFVSILGRTWETLGNILMGMNYNKVVKPIITPGLSEIVYDVVVKWTKLNKVLLKCDTEKAIIYGKENTSPCMKILKQNKTEICKIPKTMFCCEIEYKNNKNKIKIKPNYKFYNEISCEETSKDSILVANSVLKTIRNYLLESKKKRKLTKKQTSKRKTSKRKTSKRKTT